MAEETWGIYLVALSGEISLAVLELKVIGQAWKTAVRRKLQDPLQNNVQLFYFPSYNINILTLDSVTLIMSTPMSFLFLMTLLS